MVRKLFWGNKGALVMIVSKRKVETFLSLRFKKQKNLYQKKLDIAIEVIQDFLNCDPVDIGRLQADTYDHIDKVYDEEQEETSQKEWIEGYRKWKETK